MLLKCERKYKKGQGVLELTATIIMFVAMIALIFSTSSYLYLQHAMVSVAREGARTASLNPDLGSADAGEVNAAEDEVVEYVQNSATSLTGQALDEDDITVMAPDQGLPADDQTVTVQINYQMENPIPVAGFLQAFGASGEGLDTIPVFATATMRFEQ